MLQPEKGETKLCIPQYGMKDLDCKLNNNNYNNKRLLLLLYRACRIFDQSYLDYH